MAPSNPQPCDLLIEAGWVVPVEPHGVVLDDHAVAVTDGVIVGVLPTAEARGRFQPARTVSRPQFARVAHRLAPQALPAGRLGNGVESGGWGWGRHCGYHSGPDLAATGCAGHRRILAAGPRRRSSHFIRQKIPGAPAWPVTA